MENLSALSFAYQFLIGKEVRGGEKSEPGNIPGLLEVFHHLPRSERALPLHSLSLPLPVGKMEWH